MGRRNSGKVRRSAMTQRALDKLLKKKQKGDRRNDAKDWTSHLYQQLTKVEADDREK
jgi:hypothetical protein